MQEYPHHIINKELFGGGLYATVFYVSDPNSTPDGTFNESEEFLVSYIVSVTPDGDYYEWSKLFKIEGLIYPKILQIKEKEYPLFTIEIEHGYPDNRDVKLVELMKYQ